MSRNLILVALSLMTWGVGEGMFILFQPLYLEELGADPVTIGGILGAVGLAMSVAHLPAGYLADRIGRRPMMIAAWACGFISAWIMALAGNLQIFVVGSIMYGLTSFVMAPLNSYITAARGNWSVSRALTAISAAYNIGAVIGPLAGGWIGNQVGLRINFLIAACFFLVSTLVIIFIHPQPLEQPMPGDQAVQFGNLINRRFVGYLGTVFLVMFCLYLHQPLSPNFLQNERNVSLAQMGVLISARSVGIIISNLILGRLNPRWAFMLSQIAMIFSALLLWRGINVYWYFMGYFLLGGYQTARAMVNAQGNEMIKAAQMGLGYGVLETAMAAAAVLAPPLAGQLYAHNPSWIYSVSISLMILAFIIATLISPLRLRGQPIMGAP